MTTDEIEVTDIQEVKLIFPDGSEERIPGEDVSWFHMEAGDEPPLVFDEHGEITEAPDNTQNIQSSSDSFMDMWNLCHESIPRGVELMQKPLVSDSSVREPDLSIGMRALFSVCDEFDLHSDNIMDVLYKMVNDFGISLPEACNRLEYCFKAAQMSPVTKQDPELKDSEELNSFLNDIEVVE